MAMGMGEQPGKVWRGECPDALPQMWAEPGSGCPDMDGHFSVLCGPGLPALAVRPWVGSGFCKTFLSSYFSAYCQKLAL